MRQLVDMVDRLAVITWWEKYIFQNKEDKKYDELRHKKLYGDIITDEEERLYKSLPAANGTVEIRIESIIITDTKPLKRNYVNPSLTINAHDWWLINNAIDEIRKTLIGKTVTLEETLY